MFTLMASTPVGGDCTCGYHVFLDKKYTVGEFIETVLRERPGEWGYIGIKKKKSTFGDPHCEYSHGRLTTDSLPEDVLNKVVKNVTSSGGWSRMDYLISVEE